MTALQIIKVIFYVKVFLDNLSDYMLEKTNAENLEEIERAIAQAKKARGKEETRKAVIALEAAIRG